MNILKLSDHPEYLHSAAQWFSKHWGVPADLYQESIKAFIENKHSIPQWYLVLDEQHTIVAGCGIIENDFHDRTDLTPNLCALYVEENYRHQHIAKQLLAFAKHEMQAISFEYLYLVTDHTEFYEKCGWDFLTLVTDDDGEKMRMYVTKTEV